MILIDIQVSRSKVRVKGHVSLLHVVQLITQKRFAPEASNFNANNVAERLQKMSIRFSVVIHTYNVLSHSWD